MAVLHPDELYRTESRVAVALGHELAMCEARVAGLGTRATAAASKMVPADCPIIANDMLHVSRLIPSHRVPPRDKEWEVLSWSHALRYGEMIAQEMYRLNERLVRI